MNKDNSSQRDIDPAEQRSGGPKQEAPSVEKVKQRVLSLDVYRGLIMVSLMCAGFGLSRTADLHLREAKNRPPVLIDQETTSPEQTEASDSLRWRTIRYQFSHCQWVGCSFWDLVQPSFMFMVGTAMAYSYTKRKKLGSPYSAPLRHAVWRSIVLIVLSIFLSSNWSDSTNWTFVNVLAQIGLGYTFLFLLWGHSFRTQAIAVTLILAGAWLLYIVYPHSGIDLEAGAPEVGVSAEWAKENLEGVGAAWHKNANVGHAIDMWLLNQFPRTEPFVYNRGGYQTINFFPAIGWMLFGLMAGELLRSARLAKDKLKILILAGIAGLVLGQLLNWTGAVCPLVKRICTPSFILFSSGWCSIFLGLLYGVVDMLGIRFWILPFVAVGMNSITAYCIHMVMGSWITKSLKIHFGAGIFGLKVTLGDHAMWLFGEASGPTLALYEPFIRATMVGGVMCVICWWMYRQKIFIRI